MVVSDQSCLLHLSVIELYFHLFFLEHLSCFSQEPSEVFSISEQNVVFVGAKSSVYGRMLNLLDDIVIVGSDCPLKPLNFKPF